MEFLDKAQAARDLKELYDRAEPSFGEVRTSEYIKSRLAEMGLTGYTTAGTGIYGTIDAGKDVTIALRCEMDALPYNEDHTEYRHLCGHHANMVTQLAVLGNIVKYKDKLKYNIRYIFQPAEELSGGSEKMIEAGCMEGVSKILSTHTSPDVEFGNVGFVPGRCMAGSNHFDVKITGSSTHAAHPNLGTDTITAACEFIMSMQTAITRLKDPVEPGLISFGRIHGGSAYNILPEEVAIGGTFRHFNPEVRTVIADAMKTRLKSIEDFYGVKTELSIEDGTPPVINDKDIIDELKQIAGELGIGVSAYDSMSMGGDDFAYYLPFAPGVVFWQGLNKGGWCPPMHNKDYFVPDDAVYPCIRILSAYVLGQD